MALLTKWSCWEYVRKNLRAEVWEMRGEYLACWYFEEIESQSLGFIFSFLNELWLLEAVVFWISEVFEP